MIKSKIALSLLLLSASISATGCQNAIANASNTNFSDIGGHWAEATINKAISSGYVDGYPDGTFKPDASISRAEFIKIVATATGTKPSAAQGETWYQSYVDSLKQQKVLRDSDFTDYNGELTRLELTKLGVREIRDDVKDPNAFLNDTGYFYDAVKVGLVQGLAGGELGKDQPTTRAQSLKIIERIKSLKAGEKLEVDKYALSNAEIALNGSNMRSIFGKAPKITFPYTATFAEGFTFTLKNMRFVDMTDPNEPMYDYIKNNAKTGSGSLDGKYAILFDVTYKNDAIPDGGAFSPTQSVALMGFGRIVMPESVKSFLLKDPQEINGVYACIIDKETMNRKLAENSITMTFRTPSGDIKVY